MLVSAEKDGGKHSKPANHAKGNKDKIERIFSEEVLTKRSLKC